MKKQYITFFLFFILSQLLLSCSHNNTPEDDSLIMSRRYNIANSHAYHYYFSLEEMREKMPYTYMMNKYLDMALEYVYGWDEQFVKMEIEKKQFMLDDYNQENSKLADEPLCGNPFDKFFSILRDSMVIELNTFPIVRSRIEESIKISGLDSSKIDSMDMIINIGGVNYSKMEILQCYEENKLLLHESFNLEEEKENYTFDCDCDCKPNYMPSSGHSSPHYLNRYFLRSLWLTGICYRNYQKTCPNLSVMKTAMNEWKVASNNAICFREIADNGWNRFTWAIGCNYHVRLSEENDLNVSGSSTVGAVPWASCRISSNALYGTYLHELGHVLGLEHEQTRPDRDCYIDIHWENIQSGYKSNFHKYLCTSVKMYGDFDFESIMMYSSTAFAIGESYSMTKKDGSKIIANRAHLSENDVKYIQYLYH